MQNHTKYLILFLGIFSMSCANEIIEVETAIEDTKKEEFKIDENNSNKKLDSKNAVEFFLEYGKKNPERLVEIVTSYGSVKIQLFEDTPIHRANFIFLTKKKYFNSTWFHRVSEEHVVQGGNSDSPETATTRSEIGKYALPSEMTDHNFHKRGAFAAARGYKRNPEKKSNPFEFYISLGQKYSKGQLKGMEENYGVKFSVEQTRLYTSIGGSPHLDLEHTVFGQVIEGMDVVEQISKVEVDSGEWPLTNSPIEVKIIE